MTSVSRLAPIAALLFGFSAASGQSIFGRVLAAGDTMGVSGADLTLSDSTDVVVARVQADDAGAFRLGAPGQGRFLIRASRIGFSPIEAEVQVRQGEAVEVELRMAEEAIPLEPILVVARREIRQGTLDEFHDRMARMRQKGVGHFLTREQIESRESLRLPYLLQTIPGVWYWGRGLSVQMLNPSAAGGTFCSPEYYLDGRPMLGGLREIHAIDLEGVEVYRGYSEALHGYFPNRCGTIFLWRRTDWGNPFSWGRAFMAAGLVAVGVTLAALF